VDANVFWNRPRILAIRTAQVGSTSKFHSAKKQLKQVTARYLPDTLEVSDGIASGGHQDEDIESRLDATNQNLKELGEDLMGAIQRQNDILSGLMKNNHSTMLNEFAMQKKNIQSDINMSEEQEQKTSTLLTRLNKLHSDMTKQLDDLRMLLFEKEQELKKDLASQEERLQLQLTKHQENLQLEFPRLQEEMTKQQLDLKLEFPRQKDMMSNLLAQEMEILVKKIQNLQIQIAEEREYILHSTKSDIAEQ
jgi:septal ring factor EnvC (AmiA/AmiB activator)